MADKNRNGIDDSKESPKKPFKPGQAIIRNGSVMRRARERTTEPVSLAEFFNQPVTQGLNFLGDLLTGFQRNKWDSYGTGLGDQLLGVQKGYYRDVNKRPGFNDTVLANMFPTNSSPVRKATSRSPERDRINRIFRDDSGQPPVDPGAQRRDFASTLAEAIQLLQGLGGGGSISYDPQRNALRQNAAEADAHLAAMYGGLANSIAADAAGIGTAYDEAIKRQGDITNQTGQSIQQGYQSGTDMLTQQAQALGIQEAIANQIKSGQTAAGDLQQNLAANAAAGQTAQTLLNTNRASALDYNTAVKQAAQQEGAAQRAARQAALQRLLADIDIAEQQANVSAQGDLGGSALSLAQWLYGQGTDEARHQDEIAMQAQKIANDYDLGLLRWGQPQQGMNFDEATMFLANLIGQGQGAAGLQTWAKENPDNLGYVLNFLAKFS